MTLLCHAADCGGWSRHQASALSVRYRGRLQHSGDHASERCASAEAPSSQPTLVEPPPKTFVLGSASSTWERSLGLRSVFNGQPLPALGERLSLTDKSSATSFLEGMAILLEGTAV